MFYLVFVLLSLFFVASLDISAAAMGYLIMECFCMLVLGLTQRNRGGLEERFEGATGKRKAVSTPFG